MQAPTATEAAGSRARVGANAASEVRIADDSYVHGLALIVAAGAALRFVFLARQPLGLDEDFTRAALRLPVPDMLGVVAHDSAPPLHYLLTALATSVVPGLFGLRLVSALAGTALIPLVAYLARRCRGDVAGLWAAALTAFLPATVVASQTARGYALAGTLSVAAAIALWRSVESGRRRWFATYLLAAAAALWTSYFSAFALAGAGLAVVAVSWDRSVPLRVAVPWRRIAAAVAATALAALSLGPWLVFAQAQFRHTGAAFWVPPLGIPMLGGTLGQFFAGPEAPSFVPWHLPLVAAEYVAVAGGLVAFAGLVIARGRLDSRARRVAAFLLVAGLAGPLALAAISIWRPILDARYASVMWLPLLALGGTGLAFLPRRVATVAVLALAVPSLGLSAALTHRETESLVPLVETRIGAHDVVVAEPLEYLVLLAEGDAALTSRLHVLSPDDPPWYVGTAVYPPGTVIHSLAADARENDGAVLYVGAPEDTPRVPLDGYTEMERRCVAGACLTVFVATNPPVAP